MTWYELLLTLHILGAALWFGSGVAITAIAYRALAADPAAFGPYMRLAAWWGAKAHGPAAMLILVAGVLMVLDADLSMGDAWLSIALGGWIVVVALGGALIGRSASELSRRLEASGGAYTEEMRPVAGRLLLGSRIETVLLALLILDMVVKPGS